MTNREFLNTVLSANISDEINEKATALLEGLDKRNAQRSAKPSKRSIENQPVKEAIVAVLHEGEAFASAIAEKCGISTQKVSALCRQLTADGIVIAETKGKAKVYRLA